jgi:phosphatidylglycerophosphate synthase
MKNTDKYNIVTFVKEYIRFFRIKRRVLQPQILTIHITSRFLRLFTWTITYVLVKLRFTPNVVTLLSILTGIIGSFFAMQGNYILFFTLCLLWATLDCCDGELARYFEKKKSKSFSGGSFLESANSNIQYSLWIPSIGLSLLNSKTISNYLFGLSLVSVAGFVSTRGVFKINVLNYRSVKNSLLVFYFSQCASGIYWRERNRFLNYTYIAWRNLLTQFGVMIWIFLWAAQDSTNSRIKFVFIFYTTLYSIFSSVILLSIGLLKIKQRVTLD